LTTWQNTWKFEETADKVAHDYYEAIPRTAFDKRAVKNVASWNNLALEIARFLWLREGRGCRVKLWEKRVKLELVSKELNNLAAILHVYAGGLIFMKQKKRSIFQTFWKQDCCARFLFIELETSNFGYLLIFQFCWTVQSLSKIGQSWY
jgi:hypothetical protein